MAEFMHLSRCKVVAATFAAVVCVALASASTASAAVLANDGFDTTTHPTGSRQVATYQNAPGNNGIVFYTRFADPGQGTATIQNDATLGSAALVVTSNNGSSNFPVIGQLPLAGLLTDVNDNVTLSFRFRFLNPAAVTDNSANFRFGLHGNNGSQVFSDNSTVTNDDQGYYIQIGDAAQSSTNLMYREGGGEGTILSGNDRAQPGASTGAPAITDTDPHTAVLSLTRTSTTTMGVSFTLDAGTPVTGSFTSLYTFIDEVSFSNGFVNPGLNYAIDDVQVTATNYTIPEPGSLAMLGVIAAGGLLRRRRGASR